LGWKSTIKRRFIFLVVFLAFFSLNLWRVNFPLATSIGLLEACVSIGLCWCVCERRGFCIGSNFVGGAEVFLHAMIVV